MVKDEMAKRLEKVCGKKGGTNDVSLFIVKNNDFNPNIHADDVLVVNKIVKPNIGDYIILKYENLHQLVLFIGYSFIGNILVLEKTFPYHVGREVFNTNIYGVIAHILHK